MAVQTDRDASTEFTHFISIDFGTSGCGIGMVTKENESDIKLYTDWEGTITDTKCLSILLLDPSENFVSFGYNAMTTYRDKKDDNYLLFQKFKMQLYKNSVSPTQICVLKRSRTYANVRSHDGRYKLMHQPA